MPHLIVFFLFLINKLVAWFAEDLLGALMLLMILVQEQAWEEAELNPLSLLQAPHTS